MLPTLVFLIMQGIPLRFETLVVLLDPIEIKKEQWIDALANCESGGNEKIKILDTNLKYSYGLFQFQLATWIEYGKDFGATRQNISSSTLQRKVARSMLDDGGWRHWYHCSNLIEKKLGLYPSS